MCSKCVVLTYFRFLFGLNSVACLTSSCDNSWGLLYIAVPGEDSLCDITHTPVVLHHEYCTEDPSCKLKKPMHHTISTQTDLTSHNIDELLLLKAKFHDKDILLSELFLNKTTRSPKAVALYYGLPNKATFDGKLSCCKIFALGSLSILYCRLHPIYKLTTIRIG